MTPGEIPTAPRPSIGRIVTYRSKTGNYDLPAIITATVDTLDPRGVELGHVPMLSSGSHVHLTVFTAGKPGTARDGEPNPAQTAGTYQEWDVPGHNPKRSIANGSWRWPERV